jgi:hypothetical protein
MKASFNSREGFPLDPLKFAAGCLSSGIVSKSQQGPLARSLHGFHPENIDVERVAGKIWITLLSKSGAVWTWSIGQRGRVSSPNVDTSESRLSPVVAFNTRS